MPKRVWKSTSAEWTSVALLKRIYLDVAGRARGYVVTKNDDSSMPVLSFFAGTSPHLTEYPTEREARRHSVQLMREMVLTLPGEVACSSMQLHHIAGLGEREYTVKEFRPHLLNPIREEE